MVAIYPHLGKYEQSIWERYIDQEGMPEGLVKYDVHLGEGAFSDPSWPSWMAVMVKALSTKRADVVAESRFGITIFEIKRRAGLSCLGQLLGYEALMTKQAGGWKPVELVAVCEELEPDMRDAFDYYKVRVVIVGA